MNFPFLNYVKLVFPCFFFLLKKTRKKKEKAALREFHRLGINNFHFTYVATILSQRNLVCIYLSLIKFNGEALIL